MSREYDIEALLQKTKAELPPGLREKVLAAASLATRRPAPPRRWFRVAAGVAACMLWLHCAWSAALNVRLSSPTATRDELARAAAQIHELAPEIPLQEARRMSLVLHAGAATAWGRNPVGVLHPLPR